MDFMKEPGTVTVRALESCDDFTYRAYTGHDLSLIKAIRLEKLNIKGYLIGIEIESIEFSLELSKSLEERFDSICKEILYNIEVILNK